MITGTQRRRNAPSEATAPPPKTHPEAEVEPGEAQKGIRQNGRDADQVQDAKVHIAHARKPHDEGDDHAKAKDF